MKGPAGDQKVQGRASFFCRPKEIIVMSEKTKKSKQELAYERIKEAILNNEFSVNTLLVEQDLCKKFDMSRTPVREALRRLASEGFVDFVKDKGTFVSQIGLEALLQNYEVREALEGMAARLCALRITDEVIKKLEENLEQIKEYYNKKDYKTAMFYDMEFHKTLIKGACNQRLESMMNNVIEIISCVAYKADDMAILMISLEDHEKLLNAIKEFDGEKAEKIMREHVVHSKKYHVDKYYMSS